MGELVEKFPGAKWWTFDFHTHTPASYDYHSEKGERTPCEWILDYMRAEIDCVAVTDHNTGEWIDKLKSEYERMREEKPTGFRELYIFPGVELTVNGGIHVLALFDPGEKKSDIETLLGAVGYQGTPGKSDGITKKSIDEVVEEIYNRKGIVIPAHVDEPKGLFKEQTGTTLEQILKSKSIIAMELRDLSFSKPQSYINSKCHWAEIIGSDAHYPYGDEKGPGKLFTWVKMGTPNIEGLRLALIDGAPLSIQRSDKTKENPNRFRHAIIEKITIDESRYCGRDQEFEASFNPGLNAIIGGRGAGKSTIVEFLRIALRREEELRGKIKDTFGEFNQVYSGRDKPGVLTSETKVFVEYRKDGTQFRIQWSQDGASDPIQKFQDNEWKADVGDIKSRFPARIYSQKQIYEMASNPQSLLEIIDNNPDINYSEWKEKNDHEKSKFLSLRAKIREIDVYIKEEEKIKGELGDVNRKLEIFESSGDANVLKEYHAKQKQGRILADYREGIKKIIDAFVIASESFLLEDFQTSIFDKDKKAENGILKTVGKTQEEIEKIRRAYDEISEKAKNILTEWDQTVESEESPWKVTFKKAVDDYEILIKQPIQRGENNPSEYGNLIQKKQSLTQKFENIKNKKQEKENLEKQAQENLIKLENLREELNRSREKFLGKKPGDNRFVQIKLIPFSDRESIESEFRKIINKEDNTFEDDILSEDKKKGILSGIYDEFSKGKLMEIKDKIAGAKSGKTEPGIGGKFMNFLKTLPPEKLDAVECWYPGDALEIKYSPTGDGKIFKSIEQGSPGQKTAALLAFLLSYGDEPMILDQPEDDLDNHLIYDLVVKQLRENKARRQVIVCTHNPNIVVNGDAEYIIALDIKGGQSRITQQGALQDNEVREEVCKIMEGGREAFKRRYDRITDQGESNV